MKDSTIVMVSFIFTSLMSIGSSDTFFRASPISRVAICVSRVLLNGLQEKERLSLRSRRLEVVSTRKNRHPFSLSPTTSKRPLRRLRETARSLAIVKFWCAGSQGSPFSAHSLVTWPVKAIMSASFKTENKL